MLRTGTNRGLQALFAAAVFLADLSLPASSEAAGVWLTTVTLTNNSGGKVWDLEANFSGVANSIFGEKLIKPPGNITAIADQAKITINFTPAIGNGTAIEFTFKNTASPDVAFEFGNWTDQNGKTIKGVDTARDAVKVTTAAVPEPSTSILAGLGGTLLLVHRWRRRRAARVG